MTYIVGRHHEFTWPILYSAVFWGVLQALSYFLAPRLFPKSYLALDERRRAQWHVRSVSVVHAFLVTAMSVPLLFDPVLQSDLLLGYTDEAALVYAIACGYFLWDTIICIYYIQDSGVGFVVHGIVSFFVYYFSFRPFLMPFGGVFLMFELSTPFLHFNWFLDKSNLTGSKLQMINFGFLGLTYLGSRVSFGLYSSAIFWNLVFARFEEIPLFFLLFYCSANLILNGLNLYWLGMMIPSMLGRFGGDKDKKPAPGTGKNKKGGNHNNHNNNHHHSNGGSVHKEQNGNTVSDGSTKDKKEHQNGHIDHDSLNGSSAATTVTDQQRHQQNGNKHK